MGSRSKKKFVKENISPDGTKNIVIEMPDKHYPDETGRAQTIETEELGGMVKEISKIFGLNFNGADRSDGKWTIKLTSAQIAGGEDQVLERDNLDEVYGTPTKKPDDRPSTSTPVQASTIEELIKADKDGLIATLKKIGEQNAS